MDITINKPTLKFRSGMSKTNFPATVIFLHHAAGNPTATEVHEIHYNRKDTKTGAQWAGAGYHYYVHKDGSIYQLRPVEYVPAAQSGHNTHSIAVSCQGNFDTEDMSVAQKNGIIELLKWLKTQHKGIQYVKKHSDVSNTACPGKNYPYEDIIKSAGLIDGGKSVDIDKSSNSFPGKIYKKTSPQMKDDNVRKIQTALKSFGFDPGTIDSQFGEKTKQAVIKFQTSKKLKATGEVDSTTWSALFPPAVTQNTSNTTNPGASVEEMEGYEFTDTDATKFTPYFYDDIVTAQKSGIDISIDYGDGRKLEKIKGVYIRSKGVVMDASGTPLYEEYEFIGNDLKE
mgnify:CR=1 FL=1